MKTNSSDYISNHICLMTKLYFHTYTYNYLQLQSQMMNPVMQL